MKLNYGSFLGGVFGAVCAIGVSVLAVTGPPGFEGLFVMTVPLFFGGVILGTVLVKQQRGEFRPPRRDEGGIRPRRQGEGD